MTDADLQSKLFEYEGIIQMLTAKVEELVAENQRLTSELTAHQTLKAIYADSSQPANVRVRAAQAALACETPALKPVEQPLDLTAEPPPEPLATVVERQRKRMDRMMGQQIEVSNSGVVRVLSPPGSNGNGDDSDSD